MFSQMQLSNNSNTLYGASNLLQSNSNNQASHIAIWKEGKFSPKNLNPVLGISVGKSEFEGGALKAMLDLLKDLSHKGYFEKVTVIVGGLLQRHNFWRYVERHSEAGLATLLSDLPVAENVNDLSYINNLAAALAGKFYADAKAVESEYLTKYNSLFASYNVLFEVKLFSDFLPSSNNVMVENVNRLPMMLQSASLYSQESKKLNGIYEQDLQYQTTIAQTIDQFTKNKEQEIERAAVLIKQANPGLANVNFSEVAKASSRAYLLEESPFLGSVLFKLGFNRLFYPGKLPAFYKKTRELLNPELISKESGEYQWCALTVVDLEKAKVEKQARRVAKNNQLGGSDIRPATTLDDPHVVVFADRRRPGINDINNSNVSSSYSAFFTRSSARDIPGARRASSLTSIEETEIVDDTSQSSSFGSNNISTNRRDSSPGPSTPPRVSSKPGSKTNSPKKETIEEKMIEINRGIQDLTTLATEDGLNVAERSALLNQLITSAMQKLIVEPATPMHSNVSNPPKRRLF